MSVVMTMTPPAGWYPGATNSAQLRWWDGSTWTEHVQQRVLAPVPGSVPLTRRELRSQVGPLVIGEAADASGPVPVQLPVAKPAPVAETPSSVAAPESENPPAAATPDLPVDETLSAADQLRVAGGYAPAIVADVDPALRTWKYIPYKRSVQTVPIWVLALSPLWAAALALPVALLLPRDNPLPSAAVALGGGLLVMLLARSDARQLRERDFDPVASPWWMLVPLLYFILRIVRVGSGSVVPLLVYLLSEVLSVVGIFAALIAFFGIPLGTFIR